MLKNHAKLAFQRPFGGWVPKTAAYPPLQVKTIQIEFYEVIQNRFESLQKRFCNIKITLETHEMGSTPLFFDHTSN
jgi:hypothetical protein